MKRENVPTATAVLQAWADGKTVQYQYADWRDEPNQQWIDFLGTDDNHPAVLSDMYRWRIKPGPRVMFFNDYGTWMGGPYTSDKDARDNSVQAIAKVVQFIEVVHEETKSSPMSVDVFRVGDEGRTEGGWRYLVVAKKFDAHPSKAPLHDLIVEHMDAKGDIRRGVIIHDLAGKSGLRSKMGYDLLPPTSRTANG